MSQMPYDPNMYPQHAQPAWAPPPSQQPYQQPQQQYAPAPPAPYQNPGYAPQGPPQQYQPQQYQPQQYQPGQAQPAPVVHGTVASFFGQPSTGEGAPGFSFKDKPEGTFYEGIVARDVTDNDTMQQTVYQKPWELAYNKDGTPKLRLVIPVLVQPSAEFPEGRALMHLKGQQKDALAEGLKPSGHEMPKAGARIRLTHVSTRPIPNQSPQKIYRIDYAPADGQNQTPPPATQAQFQQAPPQQAPPQQAPQQQAPQQQAPQAQQWGMQQGPPPTFAQPNEQQAPQQFQQGPAQQFQQGPAQQAPQGPAQQAAPPQIGQAVGMTPEMQALLANMQQQR